MIIFYLVNTMTITSFFYGLVKSVEPVSIIDSIIYNTDQDVAKNIFKNAFVSEKNTLQAMCLFASLSYRYNHLFEETCAKWGLDNNKIYNIDNQLVFCVFSLDNKIVFSFKGSSDIQDFVNDIDIIETDPELNIKGMIHKGAYDILFHNNRYLKIIDIINDNKDKDIYFSSHSLGALTSSIMFVYIKNNLPDIKLKLITFGSPRCGDFIFSQQIQSIRIVNGNDLITKLPLPIGYSHCESVMKIGSGVKTCGLRFSVKDHYIENYFNGLQ